MLDPDISTTDALRLLSVPDRDIDRRGPSGWTRRGFLQAVGAGMAGGALFGGLGASLIPGDVHDAFAGAPIGPNDGILITIMLYGGNDGLNTVVPYGNGLYYQQRANIAVPQNQVLAINNEIGLHPNLPYVRSLFGNGQVAIVQGVGYEDPDLSHFTSMAIWMSAKYGPGPADERMDRPMARRPVGCGRRTRRGDHRLVGRRCTCWASTGARWASRRGATCSGPRRSRPTCACTRASRQWPTHRPGAGSGTTCSRRR